MNLRKTQSHGRIGEAAVSAKCWMHGVPAYNTGGLRANFAGSDIIVDTPNPRVKLWVQVKTGFSATNGQVYLTQCSGDEELSQEKFVSDFVVFVNIDRHAAAGHQHDGNLGFEHLTFFVVPRDVANRVYMEALRAEHARPLRSGGQRKLGNTSVKVAAEVLAPFKDAWVLLQGAASGA